MSAPQVVGRDALFGLITACRESPLKPFELGLASKPGNATPVFVSVEYRAIVYILDTCQAWAFIGVLVSMAQWDPASNIPALIDGVHTMMALVVAAVDPAAAEARRSRLH